MMTNDALMIVCGGGASRMIDESTLDLNIPMIFLKHDAGHIESDDDSLMVSDMETIEETLDSIDSVMQGVRVIVIFSVLGGISAGAVSVVMEKAHMHGSKVVAILGIPMIFEHGRRDSALQSIKSLVDEADQAFIIDIETIRAYDSDTIFKDLLQYNAFVTMYATKALTSYLSGPFFSTFPENAYTIAFSSGLTPKGTVKRALMSSMFQKRSDDSAILMVGDTLNPDFTFNLTSELIAETGMLPDIIRRKGQDCSIVLFFFPVII